MHKIIICNVRESAATSEQDILTTFDTILIIGASWLLKAEIKVLRDDVDDGGAKLFIYPYIRCACGRGLDMRSHLPERILPGNGYGVRRARGGNTRVREASSRHLPGKSESWLHFKESQVRSLKYWIITKFG